MIKSIIKKEFLLSGKAKNGFFSLLTLVLTFIFIFHFSLEKYNPLPMVSLIGLKWALIFFLTFVFIGQTIWEERESGALRINLVYLPSGIFFLIKGFSVFFILFIINIFIIILFYIFFSSMKLESFKDFYYQFIFLIPSGLALSFLGITLSQLSNATRLKEIILPVLLIPLSIPVLLFGMESERNLILYSAGLFKPMVILFSFAIFYGSLGVLVQEISDEV